MARAIHRLTAMAAKTKKPGLYPDGGGLYLQVTNAAAKSWIFRFKMPGTFRERYMGLGSAGTVSLERAREDARRYREMIFDGADPIEARDAERQRKAAEAAKAVTFEDCAKEYILRQAPGWKNDKHAGQWAATLETYVYPTIGKLRIGDVDTALVLKILTPIWNEKTETASRVRGRIEAVIDYATPQYRTGDNPASWKVLKSKLAPRQKIAKVKHHEAMPYADLPAFMADLRAKEFVSARALEFTVLTAVRTNETTGATWAEIDLREKVWTVPGDRMKAGKEHRVPLSPRAVEILRNLSRSGPFVFPGAKEGKPLSNMAMLELLRGMRGNGLTVHGFRSTFRDWAGDCTAFDQQTIEHALAHSVSDKTEKAYRRATSLEKRALLMGAWADYCAAPAAKGGNVIAIRGAV